MSIAKLPDINGGAPILNLTGIGQYPAGTGQNHTQVDLQSPEGVIPPGLVLTAKTTNGSGGSPTSPGAAKKWVLVWAFSNNQITGSNIQMMLQTRASQLLCTLPDTNLSDASGQREYATTRCDVTGRYLYVWWSSDAYDSGNALIDAVVYGRAMN